MYIIIDVPNQYVEEDITAELERYDITVLGNTSKLYKNPEATYSSSGENLLNCSFWKQYVGLPTEELYRKLIKLAQGKVVVDFQFDLNLIKEISAINAIEIKVYRYIASFNEFDLPNRIKIPLPPEFGDNNFYEIRRNNLITQVIGYFKYFLKRTISPVRQNEIVLSKEKIVQRVIQYSKLKPQDGQLNFRIIPNIYRTRST